MTPTEDRVDMDFNGIALAPLDVTLKQLYYFVIVAETGSITRSANRLYITQSALSKSIAQLEERIGTVLLTREGRSVGLTVAGHYLYRQWKSLIRSYRRDLNGISQLQSNAVAEFRLGVFPVLNSHSFLHPYTDKIARLYPGVSIEILRMNYIRLLEHLNANQADMIFMLDFDLPKKEEIFEWQEVDRVPMVAVMSADHPLAGEEIRSFSQLTGTQLIFSEPEGILSRQNEVERLVRTHNILPENYSYVNNDLTAYLKAEQGYGVAIGIKPLYPAHHDGVVIRELEDMDFGILAVWQKSAPPEIKSMIYEILE